MAGDDIDEDEYVARLLKQDAMDSARKYSLVGLDAFHSKRAQAPKPNTGFLRHIIRQTESHNAALRAKETKDSRARLQQLDTAKESARNRTTERRDRRDGKVSPTNASSHTGRRERKEQSRMASDEERDGRRSKSSRHDEASRTSRSRRERSRHRHRHRHRHRDRDRDRDRDTMQQRRLDIKEAGRSRQQLEHSNHGRHKERHSEHSSDEEDRRQYTVHHRCEHTSERCISRSEVRLRSSSPASTRRHRSSQHHYRSRSPRRTFRSPAKQADVRQTARGSQALTRHSPSAQDESDPLEAIVGPLPPPKQSNVRSRGRGAHTRSAMGIDARFSSVYDPAMDAQPVSDNADEWNDAVEAFRDRQQWKQQGAERLKAAGFSEEQVKKWEQGDERNEEDVRWTARGQAREWDRGKVVDADGDVALKAGWTEG